MATNFKSLIEKEVDRLFDDPGAAHMNPVTGAINWAREPIGPQKRHAVLALLAREWLAVNGPPDAPPLPLNIDDRDRFRGSRGLTALVGFYARSLSRANST